MTEENAVKAISENSGKAPLLKQILESDLSRVAIFSGAGVDPDGLASQATMDAIIRAHSDKSEVFKFYRGTFDRPQNKTMRQTLGLEVQPESNFVGLHQQKPFTCIISVDGPTAVCPTSPHFIIDHHEQSGAAEIGNDVRMIGSASAILWEYAMEAGINFESEEGAKLATAIAIGIMTDTKNGGSPNSSPLDFEALGFVLTHKDAKLYDELQNYPKPSYYNDMFVLGWQNKVQHGTVLVTGLGPLPKQRCGVISDLAEKYAETEGVTTAVVCAIVDNDIEISVRSSNNSLNVHEFVQSAFGSGGGKRGAGRAVVKMPLLFQNLREDHNTMLWQAAQAIIIDKALRAAGDGARPTTADVKSQKSP